MILLWLNVNVLSTTFYCCNVSSFTLSTLDLVHHFPESFDKVFFVSVFITVRIHTRCIPQIIFTHPHKSASTSTSTLFTEKSNYNRLARKMAIANLGGPVKRKNKVKGKERKGKEEKYF